jgi:hypothetical protein
MDRRVSCREEGLVAFWKGNGTNIIRIFPYSAAQLSANDVYKRNLATDGELSVVMRLTAGACAGMTATALTHPLDTLRLRLALPNHGYAGVIPPGHVSGLRMLHGCREWRCKHRASHVNACSACVSYC